jgi:hypothetical protein
MGMMFDIIDAERGQKAILIPLATASVYLRAFENRVQQMVDVPGGETFSIWCAQHEDVIIGKLMAWEEGRSRKHEDDIYEILVFHYLQVDPELSAAFNEHYIDEETARLGDDVAVFWQAVKTEARTEADRQRR